MSVDSGLSRKRLRVPSILQRVEDFIHGVTRRYLIRWLGISVLIGMATGTLIWVLSFTSSYLMNKLVLPVLESMTNNSELGLIRTFSITTFAHIFVLLLIGHLLSYVIVRYVCNEARGSGCDIAFYHYVTGRYLFPIGVPFLKVLATIPTLGLGASVGKEGPAVLIGASMSSIVHRLLRLNQKELKIAYIAGISAGISAALGAPLGGTVFGIEFLRVHEIELEILEILYPCLVAALSSYMTFQLLSGGNFKPVIPVHVDYSSISFTDVRTFLSFIMLGIITGFFCRLYAELYHVFRLVNDRLSKRAGLIPVLIASLVVALIGTVCPMSILTGYYWLSKLLQGSYTIHDHLILIPSLVLVILLKIVATSITVTSGCSGGIIAPTIVTGGYAGFLTFLILKITLGVGENILPLLIVAGTATLLGCAFRIPVSAILIVADMTGTWIVTPLVALSMAIAYVITGHWSLYPKIRP